MNFTDVYLRASILKMLASPPAGAAPVKPGALERERVLWWQPTGPNPLYHRDDKVNRLRGLGV